MAVEASDKPILSNDFDEDDDGPLTIKRYTSSKKNQLHPEVRKSTSHSQGGHSYRQISGVPSSNGQPSSSSTQKSNTVPSTKASPLRSPVGISKPSNLLVNSSSVKLSVANSKSPSLGDKPKPRLEQKMSIDVKKETKSIKDSAKNYSEDSEDEEDNKPLSARLKMNVNHHNKATPAVVKKSSDDSDDDDNIPLSAKLLRNSNLGTSSSNYDDSDQKKPISKVQKERQNGSSASNKPERPSTLPVKRPIDNSNSMNSLVKKSKISDPATSIKPKQVPAKCEPKVEDDDDDDVPISQRMKKSATTSADKSSSIKKVTKVTKVTKVNKASSPSFKKQAKNKKLKKSGGGSEYSKSTKLLPSSGDGQKKWTTLVHNGVIFPPPYQPHGVKMTYKGKPVDLTPEQEEVGFISENCALMI